METFIQFSPGIPNVHTMVATIEYQYLKLLAVGHNSGRPAVRYHSLPICRQPKVCSHQIRWVSKQDEKCVIPLARGTSILPALTPVRQVGTQWRATWRHCSCKCISQDRLSYLLINHVIFRNCHGGFLDGTVRRNTELKNVLMLVEKRERLANMSKSNGKIVHLYFAYQAVSMVAFKFCLAFNLKTLSSPTKTRCFHATDTGGTTIMKTTINGSNVRKISL